MFDFSNINKCQHFDLASALKLNLDQLDVSIVVNNVGIGRNGLFYENSENEIKQMIKVNILS